MANGKSIVRIAVIMIALVGVLGFHLEAIGMVEEAPSVVARPDVIMIDTIAKLEELEQPAAVFKHDAHTKALKDQGMSCDSCHKTDAQGNMVLLFSRTDEGQTAAELKDIYHDNCITCHVKSGDKGFKTGPMVGECRSCHQEKPAVTAARENASMNTALHTAHWTSKAIKADAGKDTNCGSCHKKPGEEDAWRFNEEFAAKPVNDAYHSKCVTCHQGLIVKKALKSGPVECAGCHGAAEKAAYMAKLEKMDMPRLPRKQPDAALMFHGDPGKVIKKGVAFNHKAHEAVAENCITCHVKGVNAPMDKSFQAMHALKADSSCVGCHIAEQEKPECAGCHAARTVKAQPAEDSCYGCHAKLPEGAELILDSPKEKQQALAELMVAARPTSHAMIAVEDIPDVVEIGTISDKFKASKMPHRKIVLKLMEGMKDSPLAARFHAQPQSMCSGCHHNSPAASTPKCSSCHAKAFTAADGRPGLKAAYHQQCMDCHTKMKLEKPAATDCAACHEKKAN